MNEELNDAFETYFPKHNAVQRLLNRALSKLVLSGLKLRSRLLGGKLLVNERIVEYPQIFQWIRPGGKVLDIGCVTSRMPMQLASLGYEVHGLDFRQYPFSHPNFNFHRADIFKWSPEQSFDIVLLISALEHFGLGDYGDLVVPEADKLAVEKIFDLLSDNGQLIVTLPFGKPEVTKKHRIYDMKRLKFLFSDFTWKNQRCFKRIDDVWFPSSVEELEDVASSGMPPNGVMALNLIKQ